MSATPGPTSHVVSEEHARVIADMFKALSDPKRLSLLYALMDGERNVTDLARATGAEDSLSAVSHHLRLLRNLRIVRDRREGKQVFYALDDSHIADILVQTADHVSHR